MATDASVTGLKPNNFAVSGWKPYTATCVAAKSNANNGISYGCGTAATATTSNFGRIAGIRAKLTLKMIKNVKQWMKSNGHDLTAHLFY
jgi:hypothetical protein